MKKQVLRVLALISIIFINIIVNTAVFAADEDFPRVNIERNKIWQVIAK